MRNNHLKLLRMFLDSSETLTASALATNMSVSDRSVKNYISEINCRQPGLINSSHRGYTIDKERAIRILASYINKLPQTADERVNYLLTTVLNKHQSEEKSDLYALSENLCVSYETIKKDLLAVRRKLRDFNLFLAVVNDHMVIEGQEQDKRRMFSSLLYAEFSTNILSLAEIGKVFPKYDIDTLVSLLMEACKSFNYFINEYALLSLVLDVIISIDRIKNNHAYTQLPVSEQHYYDEHEMMLARKVITDIEQTFEVVYNPLEAEALTVVLLGSLIRIDMDTLQLGNIQDLAGEACMALVEVLLKEMRRYEFIDGSNEQFLVRFTIHIKNLLVRLQHGHVTRNPLTEHIRTSCPLIFECAVAISEKIKQATGFLVDENEIAYIALHIGSILGNQLNEQNKVSCVLLVPQYHNHTNSLMAQLNEMFGQQLTIRAIVTSWSEYISLPQPDFLISTLQIPKSMVEWVLINPFLTDRDVSALQYKIERVKQKKKRQRLQDNLQKISDETLFFHNPAFSNENQAIEFMAQALNQQGYVDENFIQDVFQREHSYPTTFGSIAVPHSMKMDAIKTGLCVAISEKPFPWGDNMVNMALMFSINKAERAIFYDIFDNIIVLLLEPANLKKALECRSWKEFIVTITTSF